MRKRIIPLTAISLGTALASCGGNSSADFSKAYQEGYDSGYAAGSSAGSKSGHDSGYQEGYDIGFGSGMEIGYDDGYIDGYQDGKGESGKGGFLRPGTNLSFHTELQQSYIDDDPGNISKYASGASGHELCAPEAITLDWSDVRFAEKCTSYVVVISDASSFASSVQYTTDRTSVDVYNLKLGTNYFWYVKAVGETTNFASPIFNFSTKNGLIRNLYIQGSSNWRDLGNYTLRNGKKIKQGLLYRSAAFNFVDGQSGTISQAAKNCILNELKIKTDIALADTPSISELNKVNAAMKWEGVSNIIADKDNQAAIKTVFNALGQSATYPAVFHCTRGRDRTGAVAFLLGAYLGMERNDLHRDYLFTNFSASNSCSIYPIEGYETYLLGYDGENLQERATSYLKAIGVSEATLQAIASILVG